MSEEGRMRRTKGKKERERAGGREEGGREGEERGRKGGWRERFLCTHAHTAYGRCADFSF